MTTLVFPLVLAGLVVVALLARLRRPRQSESTAPQESLSQAEDTVDPTWSAVATTESGIAQPPTHATEEGVVRAPPAPGRPQFDGKGGDIFSREGLRMILWFISLIGIPFGMIYMYRWLARKTWFPVSDTTETAGHFAGTAEQLYPYFVGLFVVGLLKHVDTTKIVSQPPMLMWFVLVASWLALVLLQSAISYDQFLWGLRNLELGPDLRATFRGRLLPYFAWTVLSLLSIFTLVGWAWVGTAYARWTVRNIEVPGYRLAFRGSALGLLWRGILAFPAACLILPIPWLMEVMVRWGIENIEVQPLLDPSLGQTAATEPL